LGTAVVLPELKTFELSEKCSTLSKLLKTCGNGVSDSARKLGVEQQLVWNFFNKKNNFYFETLNY